ncbi:MAG: 23S rRNA (adenine(2503)-C(2))-methyltransferase RlmN, partial [bacterium]|nr:23S rRNA (adenine(2503)-C(2))-methyltransferase RlmN [bacterium]
MGDVELPQIAGDDEAIPAGRIELFGLDDSALVEVLARHRQPRFRGTQILEWVYGQGVSSFDEMTNLPKKLRAELADVLVVYQSQVARRSESQDGTVKLLLRWPGGATSECVLIPDGERRTACISTQVGCPVGCKFCASGLDGLERDLTTAQIVEQLMRVAQLCQPLRVTNVVFMGLGEPLANYAATVAAVRIINAPWGPNVGARKITVSTVGLPSQMRRLATEGLQITLALSVHAPTDDLRRELIPWAKSVALDELVAAGREYFDVTGREVTLEYLLLGGVNDQPVHARQLAALSKRLRSHVNLIPYNPVPSLPYTRPTERARQDFLTALRGAGVNAHL